jgi:hypothetical protein
MDERGSFWGVSTGQVHEGLRHVDAHYLNATSGQFMAVASRAATDVQ